MSTECKEAAPEFMEKLQGITAHDLMSKDLPPIKWIVPTILPEGATLLCGKPKIGKSWLALGLAIAVAQGTTIFGHYKVIQSDVCYLALEDNHRRLKKRLGKILQESSVPKNLRLFVSWKTESKGGLDNLDTFITRFPKTKLIIVDTLEKIRRNRSSNMYQSDCQAITGLKNLADKHAISVLIIHHVRKMPSLDNDPFETISGSYGLSGSADGVLILRGTRHEADAELFIDGRDIEKRQELALRWHKDLGQWKIMGNAEDYRRSMEQRAVINMLKDSKVPLTPKDVSKRLEKPVASIRVMLARLANKGIIKKIGHGQYTMKKH